MFGQVQNNIAQLINDLPKDLSNRGTVRRLEEWNEKWKSHVLDNAKYVLELDSAYEAMNQLLINRAESFLTMYGQHYELAHQLALIIHQRSSLNNYLDKALEIRARARGQEVLRDLKWLSVMYSTKLQAADHKTDRLEKIDDLSMFRFNGWHYDQDEGYIVIPEIKYRVSGNEKKFPPAHGPADKTWSAADVVGHILEHGTQGLPEHKPQTKKSGETGVNPEDTIFIGKELEEPDAEIISPAEASVHSPGLTRPSEASFQSKSIEEQDQDYEDSKLSKGVLGTKSSYQLRWNYGDRDEHTFRMMGKFLGYDHKARGLVFEVDKRSGKKFMDLERQFNRSGSFRFVEDDQTAVHLGIVNRYIDNLEDSISRDPSNPTVGNLIMDRLTGLNINNQRIENLSSRKLDFQNPFLLNDPDQTRAVEHSTELKDQQVVAWWGGPGSGKTTTSVESNYQFINHPDQKTGNLAFYGSQGHAALDNVAEKLEKAGIPYVRLGSQISEDEGKVGDSIKDPEMKSRIIANFKRRKERTKELLRQHREKGIGFIILGTNNGLEGDNYNYKALRSYIDENKKSLNFRVGLYQEEGSKATLPETARLVEATDPDFLVIIGDDEQLPSTGQGPEAKELVLEEVGEKFVPELNGSVQTRTKNPSPEDKVELIYSERHGDAEQTSPFERAHQHEQWGGVPVLHLKTARRGIWVITELFNRLIYDGRLIHADKRKYPSQPERWKKFSQDTIKIIDVKNPSDRDPLEEKGSTDNNRYVVGDKSASTLNYKEVGEIFGMINYYLNLKERHRGRQRGNRNNQRNDNYRYQPKDLLILSPYKAQNEAIGEVIEMSAILNDLIAGERISMKELERVSEIVKKHIKRKRKLRSNDINRILHQLKAFADQEGRKPEVLELVIELNRNLKPLYNLFFRGHRRVRRADIEILKPETVDSIQGHENKVVLISFVRSNFKKMIGFLDSKNGRRRLNVSISRPIEKLGMVGSFSETLSNNDNVYSRIIPIVKEIYQEGEKTFLVNDSAPREAANLRKAWNLFNGANTLHRFIRFVYDYILGIPLESVLFISIYGIGLESGSIPLIILGLTIKLVIFPYIHHLKDDRINWGSFIQDLRFSTLSVILFSFTWMALGPNSVSPDFAVWISMIPPVLFHYWYNLTVNNHSQTDLESSLPSIQDHQIELLEGVNFIRRNEIRNVRPTKVLKNDLKNHFHIRTFLKAS